MPDSLQQRIDFIKTIDALKEIQRKTYLLTQTRYENSAEHSWHVSTLALTFADYAPAGTDINRVIHMLLLHDIVEIDAGDTLLYDTKARAAKAIEEQHAATRIFGLLPTKQAQQYRALWDEFETEQTPESQFAAALDRFSPLLHNLETQGQAWRENKITLAQVIDKNQKIATYAPELWSYIHPRILNAAKQSWLLS